VWEKTDNMPNSVEITITMGSSDPGKADTTITKVIDIPCTATAKIGAVPLIGRSGTSGTGRQSGQGQGQNTSGGS